MHTSMTDLGTLHVLIGSEVEPDIPPPCLDHARCIDLRVRSPSSQVGPLALGWSRPSNVLRLQNCDRARAVFLEAHASVLKQISDRHRLTSIFCSVGLGQLLPVSVKHPHHPVWAVFVAYEAVLELATYGATAADPLLQASSIQVWCTDSTAAEVFANALSRLLHIPACSARHKKSSSAWSSYRLSSVLSLLRMWLSFAKLSVCRARRRQSASSDSVKTGAKCGTKTTLIAADYQSWSWTGPSPTAPSNRYFGDMPAELAQHGIHAAWLPIPPSAKELYRASEIAGRGDSIGISAFHTCLGFACIMSSIRFLGCALTYGLERSQPISFCGADLAPLVSREVVRKLGGGLLTTLLVMEFVRSATRRLDPYCLIIRSEFYLVGRSILVGTRLDVPVVSLQHGTIRSQHIAYQHCASHLIHLPRPTFLLTYTEQEAEFICRFGYPRDEVISIGSPRHDSLLRWQRMSRSRMRESARNTIGLSADSLLLVFFAQLPQDIPRRLLLIFDALGTDLASKVTLAFRPHWRFSNDFDANSFLRREGITTPVLDASYHDAPTWIAAADLVLTGTSTVGYEALRLGVELGCFSGEDPLGNPYLVAGEAFPIGSPADLRQAIFRLLTTHAPSRTAPERSAIGSSDCPENGASTVSSTSMSRLVEVLRWFDKGSLG